MIRNNFIKRHNGPTASDAEKMLKVIGVKSQEQLRPQHRRGHERIRSHQPPQGFGCQE